MVDHQGLWTELLSVVRYIYLTLRPSHAAIEGTIQMILDDWAAVMYTMQGSYLYEIAPSVCNSLDRLEEAQ